MIRYQQDGHHVKVFKGNCELGEILQLPLGVMFVTQFTQDSAPDMATMMAQIERAHAVPVLDIYQVGANG